MNPLRARVSSLALVLTFAASLTVAAPVRAEGTPLLWFAGTRLVLDRPVALDEDIAVSTRDPGLAKFLAKLGATIAYQPQQRYIVVTAADRRTISFAIGSAQYSAGGVTARAAFAPFIDGTDAIVPLYAIARALYVEPVAAAGETVLQPQIGALDIRSEGKRTTVAIRGATALTYVRRVDTPERLELVFNGIASTLAGSRRVGILDNVVVTVGGSPKNPTTTIAFDAQRGTQHEFAPSNSPYEVALAFGGAGVVLGTQNGPAAGNTYNPPANVPPAAGPPLASAPPPPPGLGGGGTAAPAGTPASDVPTGNAPALRAVVTGVTLQPLDDGLQVRVTVNGTANYDWHRLADQRWYVDIRNATLTDAGRDERPSIAAVESVRIRQIGTPGTPDVRIALTLRGEKTVTVTPTADGLTIVAGNAESLVSLRSGSGRAGYAAIAQGDPSAQPPDPALGVPAIASPWKFGPAVNGSRVIVLDPGHGGGDVGTAHNGLVEKNITLDIARRLRSLLAAQGWTVRMTRDADVDPVSAANLAAMRADGKPNPDDRAYLQTRCDVANAINARMFISIHVNYAESPNTNGSTFYWYKPEDQLLAQTLERAVIPAAGTNDMGPRHENFYVTRHTTVPAVLIETAFISNAHDAQLLASTAFLQNVAQGIANGVKAYAGVPPVQSSQNDQ